MRSPRTPPGTNSGDDPMRVAAPSLTDDDQRTDTYPEILREYASSGFRDDLRESPRRPGARRSAAASQRSSDELGHSIERYGELGPFWNRRG